jgi:hypothetical protein
MIREAATASVLAGHRSHHRVANHLAQRRSARSLNAGLIVIFFLAAQPRSDPNRFGEQ